VIVEPCWLDGSKVSYFGICRWLMFVLLLAYVRSVVGLSSLPSMLLLVVVVLMFYGCWCCSFPD